MPNVTTLIQALSLDVTANLVAVGVQPYTAPWMVDDNTVGTWPMAITGASNASPIVITTQYPHNYTFPFHGVITGVTGNTNSNGTWIFTPVPNQPNQLSLSILTGFPGGSIDGTITQSVGNGAYAGGGQLTTALSDGVIALGEQHAPESGTSYVAPRIVFIPRKSKFTASTQAMRGPRPITGVRGAAGQTPEMLRERSQKMIAQEEMLFEVVCWGAANPPNPYGDFNVTQVIYQQVIRSAEHQIQGTYSLGEGEWDATRLSQEGHQMSLMLMIKTPVAEYPLGVTTIQTITGTVEIQTPPNDTTETAWSGTLS